LHKAHSQLEILGVHGQIMEGQNILFTLIRMKKMFVPILYSYICNIKQARTVFINS